MSWKDRADFGSQVVADAFEKLSPPALWVHEQPSGFVWWPSSLAQRIWADPGVFRNGRTYYRLHAELDLLKGRNHCEAIASRLEEAMDDCDLSCLIYDKDADVFRLHASVFAEQELWEWVCPLFIAAAQSQLFDSAKIVKHVEDSLHPVMAMSEHPFYGMRQDVDPRMTATVSPYYATGAARSRWGSVEEWRKVDWALERQGAEFQPTNKRSSISKFFWQPDPKKAIELFISSEEPHPTLGNGLHYTLTIPLDMSSRHIAYMALDLNNHERNDWLNLHLLGSWCNHAQKLAFRLFVPNALYSEGLLEGLTVTMAARAIWANEYFIELKSAAEGKKATLN